MSVIVKFTIDSVSESIKKDETIFPVEIWNIIKEYAGIYDIKINWNNEIPLWLFQTTICDAFRESYGKDNRDYDITSWHIAFNHRKIEYKATITSVKYNFWNEYKTRMFKKQVFQYIADSKHFK